MDIINLKDVFLVSAIFILINFSIGFSIHLLFFKRNIKEIALFPLVGFCVTTILLVWLNSLFTIDVAKFILFILALISTMIMVVYFYRERTQKRIREILASYINITVVLFFLSFATCYIFFIPQRSPTPIIPSYEVNHDPLVIISFAKFISDNDNSDNYQFNSLISGIDSSPYPLGFILNLSFYSNITNVDYYSLSSLLISCIYSLTVIPLFLIFNKHLSTKHSATVSLSFCVLFQYLSVQVVNQGFYQQVMLLPLLITLVYLILNIRSKIEIGQITLLVLFAASSTFTYSYTFLLWIIPLLIIISPRIYKLILNDKKQLALILLFGAVYLLIISPYLMASLGMLQGTLNNTGQEQSILRMKGNSIGYANYLTSFNVWSNLDYRIQNVDNSVLIISFISFVLLMIVVLTALNKFHHKYDLFIMFIVFTIPVIFFRFFTDSPYIYNKTLFYASFIYSVITFSALYIHLTSGKLYFKIISAVVFFILINNAIKSLNYLPSTPISLFNEQKSITNQLMQDGVSFAQVVDDEDWGKYFFLDIGGCISFARSYSCDLGVSVIDNENFELKMDVEYFVVRNKYRPKINNIEYFSNVFSTENYDVYKKLELTN